MDSDGDAVPHEGSCESGVALVQKKGRRQERPKQSPSLNAHWTKDKAGGRLQQGQCANTATLTAQLRVIAQRQGYTEKTIKDLGIPFR